MTMTLLGARLTVVLFAALVAVPACSPANILAVFPSDYKSHFTLGSALFTALAERGHHITLIAQHPLAVHQRHANITEIRLDGVPEHFREIGLVQQSESLRRDQSVIDEIINLIYGTAALANYTLSHPDVQRLLRSSQHGDPSRFDLVLLDMYFNDALLGLGEYFGGVPTVVLCSTATNKWTNEMVGNPHSPAYMPSIFLGYTDRMGLMERWLNALASAFEKITYNFMYLPVQENIYHRYFTAPATHRPLPPLIDLIHNVSLVLLNSHASLQYARPYTPNMLHIGGMHLPAGAAATLAEPIDEYMSAAPDGVIYMSLGSARRSADLPAEQIAAFIRVFRTLIGRMRIVWKWENATMTDQPANVIIGPYMPQQAILSHPNVRLFITNGGASSVLEAIDSATPIVGVPMHGDQFFNVAQAVHNGLGVQLEHRNLTDAAIAGAIEAVLNGTRASEFAANARRLRDLLHDNAVAPLKVAVHGVEHVLRTGGARHWRSPAVDLSLWQQSLVDVALIIAVGLAVIVAVPSVVICLALRRSHAGASHGGGTAAGKKRTINNNESKSPRKQQSQVTQTQSGKKKVL